MVSKAECAAKLLSDRARCVLNVVLFRGDNFFCPLARDLCTSEQINRYNKPSQAALERSSQDAYDVIRLTRGCAISATCLT